MRPYTSIFIPLEKTSELFRKILSSKKELFPRRANKLVILYGAGPLGRMAKDFFTYLKMPFLYVVDKHADKYKNDEHWKGVRLVRPDEVPEADKKNCLLVICVVTIPCIALRNELVAGGWKDTAIFYDVSEAYRNKYPLSNGWFLGAFNLVNQESVLKVFSSLSDDVSRAHYTQFLAWRRLRVELLFEGVGVDTTNRFFIPEVADILGRNETFVDCGAHHGSVSEKFLNTVQHKYGALYAVEPDRENFAVLQKRLARFENIILVKRALSDQYGEEKFYEGFDFASKLEQGGNSIVKTITLDSLQIPATFMKLHLEGGELGALKGAVKTIKQNRPIVAVTIYHSSDGAWKIPMFLIRNTQNYRHYIRLHSWAGTGAVFYAIPEERIKTQKGG